jgi:hypothetical protein
VKQVAPVVNCTSWFRGSKKKIERYTSYKTSNPEELGLLVLSEIISFMLKDLIENEND